MPKGVAKGRKLIAVPDELIRELNELANKEGVPFYHFTADALEQAVRAGRMNRTLREITDFYEIMEMRKASGYVLVPQDTLNWLIEKLYPKERDNLHQMWLNAGKWLGKFLAAKLSQGAVDFFIKMLKMSEWKLDEVSLEEKGDVVSLRLISFTLPEENTELLAYYVEGVMQSLGYQTRNKECIRGMINLEFKKGSA